MINYFFLKYFYIKLLRKINGIIHKLNLKSVHILDDYIAQYIQKNLNTYFIKSRDMLNKNMLNIKYKNSKIIWVFWWQGIYYMPSIVKLCIKSIKKNAGNHKVILIDKYNIENYTDIPKYIYDKLDKNYITLTHFSDILRFNLLKNHGGLWMDSTIYCSSELNDNYFHYFYTSGGYKNTFPRFVNGKWTGFLIGGDRTNPLFTFMDNYFKLYWKYNNYQLDYFLVDYGLYYAYKQNIGYFKDYVDKYAINNNPHLFDLAHYLNFTYDNNIYKDITNDTNLFKLTYKMNFNLNKNNTFYLVLMSKYFKNGHDSY